jgi:hypothetical protein
MTVDDQRRVSNMGEPDNIETDSGDLVIALSPKQLVYLVVFIGFVVILTRARRRAGRI